MKKLILLTLLFASVGAFAQSITKEDFEKATKPLEGKLAKLELENQSLKKEIGNFTIKMKLISQKLDSIQKQTVTNNTAIAKTNSELGNKIRETGKSSEAKISAVDKSLSKKSLYGIIGVLTALLLSGLIYLLLSKRQNTDRIDLIDQLSKTKSSIEEGLIKEFGKQTELMDSQLHLIEKQKTTIQATPNAVPDHSLALKVADEITLIGRNISLMDKNVKGIKQLLRSVQKLKDNLSANGYDLPDLLGKQFNEGMKLIVVNSVPDENLQKGDEIISKIIKPQVNFNDKMIQPAQVEVSVG